MADVAVRCQVQLQRFDTGAEQATALAQAVAKQLQQGVASRGSATLAVSGGRSPIPFFEQLRQWPLPWSQIVVMLVDERCVPSNHADSNARLVREHLLQGAAAAATFVDWLSGVAQPEHHTPSALVEHALQTLHPVAWPLDVVVLGMGEDGHTASWFPDSPGLATALGSTAPLAWVRPAHAPHLRLTLTLGAVTGCRHLHLAIGGAHKRQVLDQALEGHSPGPELPIQTLLNHAPALQAWIAA